jgi:hypothetical protein
MIKFNLILSCLCILLAECTILTTLELKAGHGAVCNTQEAEGGGSSRTLFFNQERSIRLTGHRMTPFL